MYGNKSDNQGQGDAGRGKKSGRPKPSSSASPSPQKSSPSKSKAVDSAKPVIIKHPEPRHRQAQDAAAHHAEAAPHGTPEPVVPTVLQKSAPTPSTTPLHNARDEALVSPSLPVPKPEGTPANQPQNLKDSSSAVRPPSSSAAPRANENKPTESTPAQISKTPPPPSSWPPRFKLLNDAGQFQSLSAESLKLFMDHTAELFTPSNVNATLATQGEVMVIGVLGKAGAGKSTLLNAIAQRTPPLINASTPTKPVLDSPAPISILDALCALEQPSQPKPASNTATAPPFAVSPILPEAKTLQQAFKQLSIEMTVVRKPCGALFDDPSQHPLSRRINASDCIILLELESLPTASALTAALKRTDPLLASEMRNQETLLQLLSLHIGIFALTVCNLLVVADDTTCNFRTWKHLKTLEMLKWNIPELSELFHSSPNLGTFIPQLRQSFNDARQPETYEKMMLDIIARANESSKTVTPTSSASEPTAQLDKSKNKSKRAKARKRKEESVVPLSSIVTEVQIDEQKVSAISGALDQINLYSPDQEYLPTLMFAFSQISETCRSAPHHDRLVTALGNFFADSRFLRPVDIAHFEMSSISLVSPSPQRAREGDAQTVPFVALSQNLGTREADAFVHRALSIPVPRFKKPLNPREWLIAASWMWEIIKQSPPLAQYASILRQAPPLRSTTTPAAPITASSTTPSKSAQAALSANSAIS